jgi:hypothetical protein
MRNLLLVLTLAGGCATTAEPARTFQVASLGDVAAPRHSALANEVRSCARREVAACDRVGEALAHRWDRQGTMPRALSRAVLAVANDATGAVYGAIRGGAALVSSVRSCGGTDEDACDHLANALETLSAEIPSGSLADVALAQTLLHVVEHDNGLPTPYASR